MWLDLPSQFSECDDGFHPGRVSSGRRRGWQRTFVGRDDVGLVKFCPDGTGLVAEQPIRAERPTVIAGRRK